MICSTCSMVGMLVPILQNVVSGVLVSLLTALVVYAYFILQRKSALVAVLGGVEDRLRAVDSAEWVVYPELSRRIQEGVRRFIEELNKSESAFVRVNYDTRASAMELARLMDAYIKVLMGDKDNCNFLELRGGRGLHAKQRADLIVAINTFKTGLSIFSWVESPRALKRILGG